MKYKILVLDLDGTLTNKKKRNHGAYEGNPHPGTGSGREDRAGFGRPTYGIAPLAEELRLRGLRGYILSYNGGQIIDWKTKKMMYENELDPKVYPYLYECAKRTVS